MNKFENVDVLASLQQIMQQNTAAFQSDFDIDKKILTQAAKSKNAEDKVYLWFSRPNGTHCLRERDVFLRGTREHNTFRFYHEQTKERVLSKLFFITGRKTYISCVSHAAKLRRAAENSALNGDISPLPCPLFRAILSAQLLPAQSILPYWELHKCSAKQRCCWKAHQGHIRLPHWFCRCKE